MQQNEDSDTLTQNEDSDTLTQNEEHTHATCTHT